jgi:alkyl sulfatase BDS1-like metallo-beta-lactamase superfamily hydrolase
MINTFLSKDITLATDMDNLLEKSIEILGKMPEVKDLFRSYNYVYQFTIPELSFDYWIHLKEGVFTYQRGVNPEYSIRFEIPKLVLYDILKGKIEAFEAYMKGFIKTEGTIDDLFRFKNVFRQVCLYINHYIKNK